MTQIQIECQGLPCPQPVIKCKEAIEENMPDIISITVDNEAAKENVTRFLTTQGYDATVSNDGDYFVIKGARGPESNGHCEVCQEMSEAEIAAVGQPKNLIFIASDVIGSGDDELGGKLMYNFLLTLKEMGKDLWRIVMVNGGVKLAVEDAPSLEVLKELEQSGVSILVCGTCLEHFGLTPKRGAGEVTNMLDIVTSFQLATKTIRV
ncbi:sulfurtransferase-like selenium metabolism protein YedF [Pseudodesulfovibrio sp. zrk46]|uniref:sulfurtransferase-like selenium metabolism protein YedF n=1 Tax=Pseudodesulfovibrio sp. zrk46 TaxID=2725288 RepID=UPI001449D8A8|nr:sulfurtransferase-like selenium metabolism protein YedF [Pseudodesulfovibrio sp. zrk46]QJB57737.1 sulfurtransferase-like selenium metabolism protein YedF [Pseudodesulfovibrio sp. zrk46]